MKKLILLAALLLASCSTPIEAYTQDWKPKPNITKISCSAKDNIKETIKGVYDDRKNFTLYVDLVCVNKYLLNDNNSTIIIEYKAGKVDGLYYLPLENKFIMNNGKLASYSKVVFDLYGSK
jgi:hypothetical protein